MTQTVEQISSSIDQELACLAPTPSERCIFRVCDELRVENEKAYEPRIIAIGPYHHSTKYKLQEMEEHKMRYLKLLLQRRNETNVDEYVMALSDMEETARKCYAESISLNKAEFVKMMLLDGVFVIELFRKWNARRSYRNDPILQFWRILGPIVSHVSDIPVDDVKHLLHLAHGSMCISFAKKVMSYGEMNRNENYKLELINTITELQKGGIEFKFLPDIYRRYVTDYATFMDCLVNSPKDAALLRCSRIIHNHIGDDTAVCNMLNKLPNNVMRSENFCYTQVFKEVNKHCKRPCNKWIANLRRNYFNSPWAFISVVGAIVLLLLTVAQTIFSALSYF
ncbi:unnamed protein product [Ilex paraguariensis]|uniref:Uncharacterized protein n=1 Tax=Ilex paraguariensis TaxID=185542 RepID=A0ABC8SW41_9AQUA